MKSVIQYINEKMVHTSSNSMKLDMVALFSYIMGMDYSKSEDDVIMALNDFTHKYYSFLIPSKLLRITFLTIASVENDVKYDLHILYKIIYIVCIYEKKLLHSQKGTF